MFAFVCVYKSSISDLRYNTGTSTGEGSTTQCISPDRRNVLQATSQPFENTSGTHMRGGGSGAWGGMASQQKSQQYSQVCSQQCSQHSSVAGCTPPMTPVLVGHQLNFNNFTFSQLQGVSQNILNQHGLNLQREDGSQGSQEIGRRTVGCGELERVQVSQFLQCTQTQLIPDAEEGVRGGGAGGFTQLNDALDVSELRTQTLEADTVPPPEIEQAQGTEIEIQHSQFLCTQLSQDMDHDDIVPGREPAHCRHILPQQLLETHFVPNSPLGGGGSTHS